jgi:hypothetical protein
MTILYNVAMYVMSTAGPIVKLYMGTQKFNLRHCN